MARRAGWDPTWCVCSEAFGPGIRRDDGRMSTAVEAVAPSAGNDQSWRFNFSLYSLTFST